ncbi:sorting nexin-24-like [Argonauta hians]
MIRVSIPSFRKVEGENDRSYTVFYVQVWMSGRYNSVERRYTEFEDLHKRLKKLIATPEFPPKKMLKWNPKVLEQRRQRLQLYIQTVCQTTGSNGYIPPALFDFLELEPYEPGFQSIDHMLQEPVLCSHKPMVNFKDEAFLVDPNKSLLPDTIISGVCLGLYTSDNDATIR